MSKRFKISLLTLYVVAASATPPAYSDPGVEVNTISTQSASDSTWPTVSPDKTGTSGHPLIGGVQHKERLSPVPSELMKGSVFDQSKMPALVPNNLWIRIPSWMAGTWDYKTENVTEMQNFTRNDYAPAPYSLRNEAQKTFGQQKDSTGQIWHYLKAPYSYISKLDHGNQGYERVTSASAVPNSEPNVKLLLGGSSTIYKPKNGKVVETSQSEQITAYSRQGKDGLRVDGSSKHFDMNGEPLICTVSNIIARRAKPYEEVNEQDGENLKKSFAEFLTSHNMANLIPPQ